LHNTRSIDFKTIGLLWKIAFAFSRKNITAGLTITTPKINLSGNGSTYYQEFYNGPERIDGTSLSKIYVSNYQDNLPAHQRYPWAIGVGVGIKRGKSKWHLSGEWFSKVSEYQLLNSEPFLGQSNQQDYEIKMIDKRDPVFNAGIGYEYNFNSKYAFFGSFATDFSAVDPAIRQYIVSSEVAYASMIQANMYHLGGGFLLNVKWLEITAGVSHAFAKQEIDRPFQFPEDNEDFATGPVDKSNMYIGRWKFILGFSLPFMKRNKILEFD